MPLSVTSMRTVSCSSTTLTLTHPPTGVNFSALPIRLSNTRSNNLVSSSPASRGAPDESSSDSPRARASGCMSSTTVRAAATTSSSSARAAAPPASTLAKSSTSLTRL